MSDFKIQATKILEVKPHPNADRLDIVKVHGYTSLVKRGQFEVGDLVVYITEAAILPSYLIEKLGLVGKLAGSNKDRVNAVRLRGVFSQGICMGEPGQKDIISIENGEEERRIFANGEDVGEFLGIKKYEPKIPTALSGEVENVGAKLTVAFDVQNFKRFPTLFKKGEDVVITEKLHGTFTGIGIIPKNDGSKELMDERFVVFSKGLGAKGLVFKDNKNNTSNSYLRVVKRLGIAEQMRKSFSETNEPVFILGETFGKVQDLEYGENDLSFRAFAMVRGYRGNQRYEDNDSFEKILEQMNIKRVPVLYRGPFSVEILEKYTSGKETVSGKEVHIREGVVVTPTKERLNDEIGRVCLKSVSEDYLLRKNKNATDFT